MELVVISSPNKIHSEINMIQKMFDEGLSTFHLRKPKFSTAELEEYLNCLPSKYHNKVILHSHHKLAKKFKVKGIHIGHKHRKKKYNSNFKLRLLRLRHPNWVITRSCHKLRNLVDEAQKFDYVFLSPIFDSKIKHTHSGNFSTRTLKDIFAKNKNTKVYALGGVDENTIVKAKELGFKGAAVLSSIWESEESPISVYRNIKSALNNKAKEPALRSY